jgi:hypothetical protein
MHVMGQGPTSGRPTHAKVDVRGERRRQADAFARSGHQARARALRHAQRSTRPDRPIVHQSRRADWQRPHRPPATPRRHRAPASSKGDCERATSAWRREPPTGASTHTSRPPLARSRVAGLRPRLRAFFGDAAPSSIVIRFRAVLESSNVLPATRKFWEPRSSQRRRFWISAPGRVRIVPSAPSAMSDGSASPAPEGSRGWSSRVPTRAYGASRSGVPCPPLRGVGVDDP